MPNDRIMQEWKRFEETVIPPGTHPSQPRMMRFAFFAGASAMVQVLNTLSAVGISEDDGVNALEEVHEELRELARRMALGEL